MSFSSSNVARDVFKKQNQNQNRFNAFQNTQKSTATSTHQRNAHQ